MRRDAVYYHRPVNWVFPALTFVASADVPTRWDDGQLAQYELAPSCPRLPLTIKCWNWNLLTKFKPAGWTIVDSVSSALWHFFSRRFFSVLISFCVLGWFLILVLSAHNNDISLSIDNQKSNCNEQSFSPSSLSLSLSRSIYVGPSWTWKKDL